jgi:hypothetical protein
MKMFFYCCGGKNDLPENLNENAETLKKKTLINELKKNARFIKLQKLLK